MTMMIFTLRLWKKNISRFIAKLNLWRCLNTWPATRAANINASNCAWSIVLRRPRQTGITFIEAWSTYLEKLCTSPTDFVITGDLNFHLDSPMNPDTARFMSILDCFWLETACLLTNTQEWSHSWCHHYSGVWHPTPKHGTGRVWSWYRWPFWSVHVRPLRHCSTSV